MFPMPLTAHRPVRGQRIALVALWMLASSTFATSPSPAGTSTRTQPTPAKSQTDIPGVIADNPFRIGRTLIIAHAGGDGLFPENTLYAYQQSAKLGNDVIDIDVQLSKDQVPMAIHDPTVDRTTNGGGWVRDMTSNELRKLDAGYRFRQRGKFAFRGKGLRVHTVEEILNAYPKTLATLDLKDQRIQVVPAVCQLLRRLQRTSTVYVGIDVAPQVVEFRKQCPEVHTSGTREDRVRSSEARARGEAGCSNQLVSQPPYRNDDGSLRITADSLAASHRCNTAVLTWVVDDPTAMRQLVEIGIDGMYTRRPDLLAQIVRSRQGG
jgi:glycerophosphoryl diester phosphodiesterase